MEKIKKKADRKKPIDIYRSFRVGDTREDIDTAIRVLALAILEGRHKDNETTNELRYAYIMMQITKLYLYPLDSDSDLK